MLRFLSTPIMMRVAAVLLWWVGWAGCGPAETRDPDIDKAFRILRPIVLDQPILVAGPDFSPDTTPSQFVEWFFSPFGSSAWVPPSTLEFSESELKMMEKARGPFIPPSVRVVKRLESGPGRQVVLVPDDAKGVILLEGYLDPARPPVRVEELRRASFRPAGP